METGFINNEIPEVYKFSIDARIGALLIDCLTLGLIGFLLSTFLSGVFTYMGRYGTLVGFVITMLYFGIQNSYLCKGQTIGKRVCKIKVVAQNGNFLSLEKSLVRTLILTSSFFFLNLIPITLWIMYTVFQFINTMVDIGIVYFFLFNHKTRQSLHDLICKTYVVSKESELEIVNLRISDKHYYIFGTILILVLAFITFGQFKMHQKSFSPYHKVNKDLIRIDKVYSGSLKVVGKLNSPTVFPPEEVKITLSIYGKPSFNELDYQRIALQAVQYTFKDFPDCKSAEKVSVTINSGFDIGIWSLSSFYPITKTVPEWEEELKKQEKISQ